MPHKITAIPAMIEQVTAKYDVTEAGCRLLEIVIRPECRVMSVVKKAELAGISTPTYYTLFNKDDRFKAAYRELMQAMLLDAASPAVQALAEQANKGDVQAIKLVLESSGVITPNTQTVKHEMDIGPNLLSMYRARRAVE